MWETIVNAISNLLSSGTGTAAADTASAAGTSGGWGDVLSSVASGVGQAAGPAAQLGGLGMQAYGLMQGSQEAPKQASFSGVPMTPRGMSPAQLKGMIANRQAGGVYTGGAVTPESMAALVGDDMNPEQIQQLMQQQQGFGGY